MRLYLDNCLVYTIAWLNVAFLLMQYQFAYPIMMNLTVKRVKNRSVEGTGILEYAAAAVSNHSILLASSPASVADYATIAKLVFPDANDRSTQTMVEVTFS